MKIVFLDRDGVINKFPGLGGYVTKVKDLHFLPGAVKAVNLLTKNGYVIFVISNQAGVGKGIYSKDKLNRINRYMNRVIERAGGKIRKVFYCTHRSDANCDCRKPRIGSIKRALQSMKKSIHHAQHAYFIGDAESDMEAGKRAGCKTIFVLSGKETRQSLRTWKVQPDFITKNLLSAVEIIENENSCDSRLSRRRTHQGC